MFKVICVLIEVVEVSFSMEAKIKDWFLLEFLELQAQVLINLLGKKVVTGFL